MSTAKIMIIDSLGDCSLTAAKTFMPEGYSLQATASAEQARELMSACRPDLIVADCQLAPDPRLWVEMAQELGLTAQVIAVTGRPDFEKAMEWMADGVFSVLTRPLDENILSRRAREALESCQVYREVSESARAAEVSSGDWQGLTHSLAEFYYGLSGRIDGPDLKNYLLQSVKKLTGAKRVELRLVDDLTASSCHLGEYGLEERPIIIPEQFSNDVCTLNAEESRHRGYELSFKGRHLGELYLHFNYGQESRIRHRETMLELISACAAALDSAGRYHRAVSLASKDPLTGLYNRRIFEEVLKREFSKARRHDFNLSLLCLDLDHFKLVNDRFGHQFGDLVLKAVGGVLTEMARGGDLPARLGGEEFAILLPHTNQRQALSLGERIKALMAESRFDFASSDFSQTVSQGIAGLEHFMVKSPEDMLYWADQAMYLAKREGRDTIRMAGDLPMTPVMRDGAYAFQ